MEALRLKRVLFFGEAVTLSHVVRPAVLAQALDPAQYSVTLACDPRFNKLIGKLPFPVFDLASSIDPERLLEILDGKDPLFNAETLDRYVIEDLSLIDEHMPDLIVGDMRQSLAISAQVRKIPYLNIVGAQWSPYASVELEPIDPPLSKALGEPLAQRLFKHVLSTAGSFHHALPMNVVRVKHGLLPLSWDARHIYANGDYVGYPDIPKIIPTTNLPSSHSYLGPVLWSPHVELPDWWKSLPDGVPVVYINLGSSGRSDLLEIVLEGLAQFKVTVIAATGGKYTGAVPANAYLADFLPGDAAAARSAMVICNGGSMPAQQALAQGTPVIGLVSNMDQLIFSRALARLNAGEVIKEQDVTPAEIRRLVWRLLASAAYRESAARIKTIFESMNSATRFQDLVKTIIP